MLQSVPANVEEQRQKLKRAIDDLARASRVDVSSDDFTTQELDNLWENGYRHQEHLKYARAESLRAAGLRPARVDGILALQAAGGGGSSSSGAIDLEAIFSGPVFEEKVNKVVAKAGPNMMTASDSSYGQSVLKKARKVKLVQVEHEDRTAAAEWLERAGPQLQEQYKAACSSEGSHLKEAEVQKLVTNLLSVQPKGVLCYHDEHKVVSVCGMYKPDIVCCTSSPCLATNTALVLDLKGQERPYDSYMNVAQVCKYGLALLEQLPSSLRPSILVGLTDLRKIMFLRVSRLHSIIQYEASEEMTDVLAVLCAVLRKPAAELGIIMPPQIYYPSNSLLQINSFLGAGATSVVYKCSIGSSSGGNTGGGSSSDTPSMPPIAAKVARDSAIEAIEHEHEVLCALLAGGVTTGIPEVVQILNEGQVLLLRPVGVPFSHPDENRPLPAVRQLVNVLQMCHNTGWVHRDIRPENLMLVGGAIFLVDWGFACELNKACPYAGTTKFASSSILEVLGEPRDQLLKFVTATPADDLVALVKSLYALNHWHQVQPLRQSSSTDFKRILNLWAGWLEKAPNWSIAVRAAESCNYTLVADTLSILLE